MIPSQKKRVLNFHDGFIFVSAARKHLWLMALIMCVALVIGLILSADLRPLYYSRSLVRVEAFESSIDAEKNSDERRGTLIRELTQSHILERTAARLGIKVTHNDLRKECLSNITVRAKSEHDLEIDVWAYSKEWAMNWTQALVQEYLEFGRKRNEQQNDQTIKPLTTELAEVSDTSEPSIRNLPLEIARLNQRIDEMSRVRINLQDPHLDAVAKLSLLSSLDKSVNREISGGVVTPLLDGPNSAPWEMLDGEQRAIKARILDLSRTYPPGHAQLLALNKELEGVDQKLKTELRGALERFDVEYQDLLDRKTAAEARLPEYNEFRRNNAKIMKESNSHESGQLVGSTKVHQTARAVEGTDLGGEPGRIPLTYIGLQELNDQPVWPHRLKRVFLSLLFGGLLAFGVPVLIEYRKHTTPNLEQVETTLQLRGLGTIPTIEGQADYSRTLLDRDDSKGSALGKDFDVIRKNLLSAGPPSKVLQVTMVTSALPNEGKTVVSSNLAAAFAQVEARTLLIDTDLRRGSIHRLFGYRRAPGLTNVLFDEVPIEEAIRPTAHGNRFVLTAGRHLDASNDILGSAKFAHLMTELREKFDRIVIDTPPVLGLPETLILQRHVDGVLFVVSGGNTSLRAMKAAIEMLQDNSANLCGFVLNRRAS